MLTYVDTVRVSAVNQGVRMPERNQAAGCRLSAAGEASGGERLDYALYVWFS